MGNEIIHCIGDSHVTFFSGYDKIQPEYPLPSTNKYTNLQSYRLGAVLAYNLNKLGTSEKGKEKLFDLIEKIDKNESLLLCFGEIDCRCHLIKQAELQKLPLSSIVKDCVQQYFETIDEIRSIGFRIIILGVVPSPRENYPEYPTYGTISERNMCSEMFNNLLEYECLRRNIVFVSIFRYLVNRRMNTKSGFFFDSIHLGQIARPLMVREFQRHNISISPLRYNNTRISASIFAAYVYLAFRAIYRFILPRNVRNVIASLRNMRKDVIGIKAFW